MRDRKRDALTRVVKGSSNTERMSASWTMEKTYGTPTAGATGLAPKPHRIQSGYKSKGAMFDGRGHCAGPTSTGNLLARMEQGEWRNVIGTRYCRCDSNTDGG